jgi:hypothetical protein
MITVPTRTLFRGFQGEAAGENPIPIPYRMGDPQKTRAKPWKRKKPKWLSICVKMTNTKGAFNAKSFFSAGSSGILLAFCMKSTAGYSERLVDKTDPVHLISRKFHSALRCPLMG